VLYLAEVFQRKGGIMGGGKAELKLLAYQRTEQNWSAVNGEEVIAAEEASRYSSGALLLVDLTASKQVQRLQEAGRPLVSILQNFSRLQEKFKTQEEEIEQWKQSLTYQSQELNRREMEMEARREQLEQLEEDFEQLEQQRTQLEGSKGEIDQLRGELSRKQTELEGAWDHLRGEQRRLDERQTEMAGHSVLDDQKAATITGILSNLSHSVPPLEHFQAQVQYAAELVGYKQDVLTQHWQSLEQHRSSVEQQRQDLEHRAQELAQGWQEWQAAQSLLTQAQSDVQRQEAALVNQQNQVQLLNQHMAQFDDLQQQLSAFSNGETAHAVEVDVAALENMSVQELEALTNTLQSDFDRSSQFVRGQDEELELKQQEIRDLETKINQAGEFDRISLESELADEKDAYQFLHETLVGQQRNIEGKEGILRQHRTVLLRRQGKSVVKAEGTIDLNPMLAQMLTLKQRQVEQIAQAEAKLEEIRATIEAAHHGLASQSQDLESKQGDLKHLEATLTEQRQVFGEMQGKVKLYEEMLQPIQDSVDNLRKTLDEVAGQASQFQTAGEAQKSAVGQMHEVLHSLMPQPQLAAS
jgi:chromosome segregation ATPase